MGTIFPLGSNRAGAGAAIDSTVARGDTALWDALYASLESLRTVAGRKAIVLLSDGVDDDGTGKPLSKKTVADVLALARQVNVPIYAIGLGRPELSTQPYGLCRRGGQSRNGSLRWP